MTKTLMCGRKTSVGRGSGDRNEEVIGGAEITPVITVGKNRERREQKPERHTIEKEGKKALQGGGERKGEQSQSRKEARERLGKAGGKGKLSVFT